MTTAQATTYTVEAYNLSHASENKIHDDQIARMLGFSGGLVPGVGSMPTPVIPSCAAGVATGSRTAAWSAGS
jgi:hypothetical protein